MLNLNELESRWLRYKIKSYIPHVSILLSLIIIAIVLLSVDFTTKKESVIQVTDVKKSLPFIENVIIQETIKEKKIQPIVIKKEILVDQIQEKEVVSIKKIAAIKEETKKTVIQPSLNFMNSMQSTSPEYYNQEVAVAYNKPQRSHTNTRNLQKPIQQPVKYVKPIEKDIVVEAPQVEIVKNSTISIERQNTHEDIQHVVKRFKKSNNPALSLFVAKKYYELGDYNQAYNYALITNELNNDIEESWIIFTKSLVKLDKKDKAIETLKKYINNSHSQRAKILLDNIKSGKLL